MNYNTNQTNMCPSKACGSANILLSQNQDNVKSHWNEPKLVTKTISKGLDVKRSYVKISNDKRHQLIEAVEKQGESIICAAQRLGIKYTTAKTIYKVYKCEGRADKKGLGRTGSKVKVLTNSEDKCPLSDTIKEEDVNKDKKYWSLTQNPSHQISHHAIKSSSGSSETTASIHKGPESLLRQSNIKINRKIKPCPEMNRIFQEQSLASKEYDLPLAHQNITCLGPNYAPAQTLLPVLPLNLQTPNNHTIFNHTLAINQTQAINPSFLPITNIKNPQYMTGGSFNSNPNGISAPLQAQQYYIGPQGTGSKINPQVSQIAVVFQPVLYLPAQSINVSLNTFSQSISNQYIYLPPSYQ